MPRKKETTVPIGKKIRKARLASKVAYDQLANETGFAVDYLKDIESGKTTPPVGTLLQIARALKIDSGALLKEDESKMKRRIKAYTKRTDHYAYTTLTPGAENKHLKAFMVTIDPMTDHKRVGYQHEGEEFTYVLAGKIEIIVGEHVNKLQTGDSLHFNSGIPHSLKNVGEEEARLLVVIYGP